MAKGEKFPCISCDSSDGMVDYEDHFYCFSCESRFSPEQVLEGDVKALKDWAEGERQFPDERDIYADLTKRGISSYTCRHFGYRLRKEQGKSTKQIYSLKSPSNGSYYSKWRTADKKFGWLETPPDDLPLFGQAHYKRGKHNRLVITEGEIDAMTVAEANQNKWCAAVSGLNGASSLFKELKRNFEFVNSFDEIIFWLDNDEQGKKALEKCIGLFDLNKVKIVDCPLYKDANEAFLALGQTEFNSFIWNAEPYKPQGVLSGEDLLFHILAPQRTGIMLESFPRLSQTLRGFMKHESYLITGGSGMGKSTFVNELGYDLLVNHGQKLGVFSLEDTTQEALNRYVSINLNKNVRCNDVTDEEKTKAYNEVFASGRYLLHDTGACWGSIDSNALLAKMEYFVAGAEVDWLVLDHLSIAISGLDISNERKAIDVLTTQINALIKKHDCGLIYLNHLNRNKDKDFNNGSEISPKDLRGSGSLEQTASVIIGIEGVSEEFERQLRVVKNRPASKLGITDTCFYNDQTGRFLAKDSDNPFENKEEIKDDF